MIVVMILMVVMTVVMVMMVAVTELKMERVQVNDESVVNAVIQRGTKCAACGGV